MTKLLLPLVGSHFHPPATLILRYLPSSIPLFLDPEPLNPYDPNAVRVLCQCSSIPASSHQILFEEIPGSGFTLPVFLKQGTELWNNSNPDQEENIPIKENIPVCWLGYIPRSGAKTAEGGPGNIEVLSILSSSPDWSASLSFSPTSRPLVSLLY